MNTTKRLQKLTGDLNSSLKDKNGNEIISDLRMRVEAVMSRRPAETPAPPPRIQKKRLSIESLIHGEEVENDSGKFYLAHKRVPVSYRHGFRNLQTISQLNMKMLSFLANHPDMDRFNYRDGLFLDTETTGLSGGTGTLPFLIGIGWFEEEHFVIKQIFVRDFKEERASLVFLLDVAKTKRFLVTFNGKAFDIGLLSTRLIMNRLHNPLTELPHLDLLHPSRRLLGHRTDNCRLVTLEESILGFRREGDLPGSEIPRRYFDWLKSRDARYIVDVFEHNRLDVISMVFLTIHLAETLDSRPDEGVIEPYDLIAASRLLLDRGDIPAAQRILEPLICSEKKNVARESRKILSLIFKRAGSYSDAIKLWEMMILDDPCDIFGTEELAKCYEHREHDSNKAFTLVHRALSHSSHINNLKRESLNHRLNRLRIRVNK
jgi:uncharacterized protein YprB with RNaseH-like and TPR domain